jgi:uncharacterized protein
MKNSTDLKLEVVDIENPDSVNFIIGQSHFIKTVEDIHEVMVASVPGIKFGLAFAEASGARIIRKTGTSPEMIDLAVKNLQKVAAGHVFILFLDNAFPINVLNALKNVPEVVHLFCATANPVQVIVGRTKQGSGILGVIDGFSPTEVEDIDGTIKRKEFLRKIGYKL